MASQAASAAAEASAGMGPAAVTTEQLWVGFVAGVFPFAWAGYEFWKRIDTQQRRWLQMMCDVEPGAWIGTCSNRAKRPAFISTFAMTPRVHNIRLRAPPFLPLPNRTQLINHSTSPNPPGCGVCQGSGLVYASKSGRTLEIPRKCYACGGFLPWMVRACLSCCVHPCV